MIYFRFSGVCFYMIFCDIDVSTQIGVTTKLIPEYCYTPVIITTENDTDYSRNFFSDTMDLSNYIFYYQWFDYHCVCFGKLHRWSYEANGSVLSAECEEDYCYYSNLNRPMPDDSIYGQKVLLELVVSPQSYSGNPYTGAAVSGAALWVAAGLSVPEIWYVGTNDTSYGLSTIPPINEGTYEARMMNGAYTAVASFTITEKVDDAEEGDGDETEDDSGENAGGSSSGYPIIADGSSTDTENYFVTVENEDALPIVAEVRNGTANVFEITEDMIEKLIKDKKSKSGTIIIDLSNTKQQVTGVILRKKSVELLEKVIAKKDNGIETVTIKLSKATVVLDHKTLKALVDQAKGSSMKLVVAATEQTHLNAEQQTSLNAYQVAMTFEAYVTSGGERIHDFNGGNVVVSMKFTPENKQKNQKKRRRVTDPKRIADQTACEHQV